ncbi:MAG: hypothetical protein NZ733_04095, partial [Aigarchaeota archaeon]|nr:hypothetical protein [Aigarchaeota archaeon]
MPSAATTLLKTVDLSEYASPAAAARATEPAAKRASDSAVLHLTLISYSSKWTGKSPGSGTWNSLTTVLFTSSD